MIDTNPFAELSASIPPMIQQGYVILMAILVAGGTILDMIHKKSAQYFFENAKKSAASAKREVGTGEKAAIAVKVLADEVLTSGEFCNTKRRISHLFVMYGFVIFVVASAVMIFKYPTTPAPGMWPVLWHIGALMLCFGGYWFWFRIRVDVSAEAAKWYKLVPADLFILGLLSTATFGLIWSFAQSIGMGSLTTLFFVLFVISSTTLFGTVLWSKFAHMFFKPAAAFQKRLIMADGSAENLPADYDLTSPEVQKLFPDIPEYMGKNPAYMGKGIRREAPSHY